MERPELILASMSPRRQKMLQAAGLRFETDPAHIDESLIPGECPEKAARRLAQEKAAEVAERHPRSTVIGLPIEQVLERLTTRGVMYG